jgi:hypothetical protein
VVLLLQTTLQVQRQINKRGNYAQKIFQEKNPLKKKLASGQLKLRVKSTNKKLTAPSGVPAEYAKKIANFSKKMFGSVQNMLNEAGIDGPLHTIALHSAGAD